MKLELTAPLLNINPNYNWELTETCQDLKYYADYVDRSEEIYQRVAPARGSGTGHYRVHPVRKPEGVSGEER